MKVALLVGPYPALSKTFINNQIVGLIQRGIEVDIYAKYNQTPQKLHPEILHYNILNRTYFTPIIPNGFLMKMIRLMPEIINLNKDIIPILLYTIFNNMAKRGAFSFKYLYEVIPFLDMKKYDIVHCHFGGYGLEALRIRRLGKMLRGKLITSFHGSDISRFPSQRGDDIYRELFNNGDLFLPISDHWKKKLIKMGCNENKIVVHHMGIDTESIKFRIRNLKADEPTKIISVARLEEKKGLEYGIKAVAKVRTDHPNLEYIIIGDGPLRKQLEKLISGIDAKQFISILGWKDRSEVIDLLYRAHIFLGPSVTASDGDQEGIPVAFMEAMASGLPVISTYHTGIPELVQDGVSGFLVPERNYYKMAEKLLQLITHPEKVIEMGKNGRKCIERDFNVDRLNRSLFDLYRKLSIDK